MRLVLRSRREDLETARTSPVARRHWTKARAEAQSVSPLTSPKRTEQMLMQESVLDGIDNSLWTSVGDG